MKIARLMGCMNFQIMIQAMVNRFGRSILRQDNIEENSNDAFQCHLCSITNKCFKEKYGHYEML